MSLGRPQLRARSTGALVVIALLGAVLLVSTQACSNEIFIGGLGGGGGAGHGGSVVQGPSGSGASSSTASVTTGPPVCGPCGAPCPLPCDVGSGCAPGMGYCDQAGACGPLYPKCGYEPCQGDMCGAPCTPCDPKDPSCGLMNGGEFRCDAKGMCVPGPIACCANPPCGVGCKMMEPCGTPCDPCGGAPDCTQLGTFLCDGAENCLPVDQVACPGYYHPCEASACGDPCSPCPDGMCPPPPNPTVCDIFGHCTDQVMIECKSPCLGGCGTPCRFCDLTNPNDPSCLNAMYDGICDDFGKCITFGDSFAPMPTCSCTALKCGSPCTICDGMDPGCQEPKGAPLFCDSNNNCQMNPGPMCP